MINITELLRTALEIDPKHVCLNINTITDIYPLCFIEYEDTEKIGAYITGEDGRERFLIIYKEHIVSLQVIYEQDIELGVREDQEDMMVV
jgi:hypothetical protein